MPQPRLQIAILDSVTHIAAEHRGAVVVAASHGGRYAASYAAERGVAALILNDAGIGRERAGVAGLGVLAELGVPAIALDHRTARIGEGAHGARHGRVSVVNAAAAALGIEPGIACSDAVERLAGAELGPSPCPSREDEAEARCELAIPGGGGPVVLIDSAGLVTAADAGRIVVTGSHGGLLGGRPETAIKVEVAAAFYNDAGIGCDGAGISRLPALDARGIASACVSAFSARIGDARSTYEDGIISAVNSAAAGLGGAIGQPLRQLVELIAAEISRR